MTIQKLTKEELFHIYQTYAARHFPADELKPLSAVRQLYEKNRYHGYGLYEEKELIAYALFVQDEDEKTALLDYYAVLEPYRNGGTGGAFLKLLQQEKKDTYGIYIESEEPSGAENEAEKSIRERRIAFYKRNGAAETGFSSALFGVTYRILFLPFSGKTVFQQHDKQIDSIYRSMFTEEKYRTQVELHKT